MKMAIFISLMMLTVSIMLDFNLYRWTNNENDEPIGTFGASGVDAMPLLSLMSMKKCKPDLTTFVVACQNHSLIEVPHLPIVVAIKIYKMNLTNNFIRVLHEDTFKSYESLTELILDNNRLQKITENALANLKRLKYLSLRNNYLVIQPECLSRLAFKNLNQLDKLDLSENPLGILRAHFFKPLKSLQKLYLERAVVGLKIEKDAFSGLTKLKTLSLADNKFISLPTYLETELLRMPLTVLQLTGNQWHCGCQLRWLKRVINDIMLRVNKQDYSQGNQKPKCFSPILHKDLELQMLKQSDYACEPNIFSLSQHITSTQNSNISLFCQTYADPISKVEWYKDNVQIQAHWPGLVIWNVGNYNINSTLFIKQAEHGFDDGLYRCQIANALGRKYINFTVSIVPSLRSRKVHINQILILVGIGSSIIIILIAIVGILMYIFMNKSSHFPTVTAKQTKRRHPKTLNLDNSEGVENVHFLDGFAEPPQQFNSSMYSSVFQQQQQQQQQQQEDPNQSRIFPDLNTLLTTNDSTKDNLTNAHYIQQLLNKHNTNNNCCPIHIQTSPNDHDNNSVANTNTIICPLHGHTSSQPTTQIMLPKSDCLIANNSSIMLTSDNNNNSHTPYQTDTTLMNCANDLNNSLLGNVGAFYSLERQDKLTDKQHQNEINPNTNTIHLFLSN